MPKFVFQLEGVLRHREHLENQRQRELALARAQLLRLEADLKSIHNDVQASTAHVRDHHLVGRLDMAYLAAHRRYMLGMQRRVTLLAQQMAAAKQQVDQAQRALGDASKEKKILEKLKERQQQRWATALARRERNELDELTTQLSFQDLCENAEGAA